MKTAYKKRKVTPLYPLRSCLPATSSNHQYKIALPTMEGFCFEKITDIIYLLADGNYTKIFFRDNRQILVCKTLKEVEKTLQYQAQFVRIHRSHTINLNFLQKYIKGKTGQVVLENGVVLNVSLGQKSCFIAAIEGYFSF